MYAIYIEHFHSLFKYVTSGGTSALVNIGTLYLLTEYGQVHYLQSAVVSFILAFFVSFTLQKFWTFQNMDTKMVHWQMMWYLLLSLTNLLVNTLIIYSLVEYIRLWYVAAAIVSGAILAVTNFFVYKLVIFRKEI